ncbi:MAG: Arc family DNA-binding protein [Candidatus Sedimenticola sp. (ex Thyasira tokunagai)]
MATQENQCKRRNRNPQFNLRIPDELKSWVRERADFNGRSMNSEFIQILKEVQRSEINMQK